MRKIILLIVIFYVMTATALGFSPEHEEVLKLVNIEREAEGLKPLVLNRELSDVALEKSRDMEEKGYFEHISPTHGTPFQMMERARINYRRAGENIAKGHRTPQEVVRGWMNSPTHRKNIMDPKFKELGIGVTGKGVRLWTQMFIG